MNAQSHKARGRPKLRERTAFDFAISELFGVFDDMPGLEPIATNNGWVGIEMQVGLLAHALGTLSLGPAPIPPPSGAGMEDVD